MQPKKVLRIRPMQGMWTFDQGHDVPDNASPDMFNFQVFNGYMRKRPGYAQYGSGAPGASVTGIFSTHDDTDTTRLFATTLTGLFRYNAGTGAYDAMTGGALTGNANQPFAFETSQSSLVFSQGVDNIQLLALTGTTYAALSANSFPSKFLTRFNSRLYTGYTHEAGNDKPRRVRWSANSDHTDWTSIGSGFNDLADDQYFVRNVRKLMGAMVVYTEKNIWVANRTGAATNPALFTLVVTDVGLFAPRTLVGYNTYHLFVGTDNFYEFNGAQVVPLLQSVRDTVYGSLNPNSKDACFGILNYDAQEYLAFICTSTNSWPDTAWAYNTARGVAYPWKFTFQPTCATIHRADNSLTIAQLVGTIAQQNFTFDSVRFTQNFPIILLGSTDGKVYQLSNNFSSDNGAAITCRWTSRDFTSTDLDQPTKMITLKSVGITVFDPGTAFTLNFYYSVDSGATWSAAYPLTIGGESTGAIKMGMSTVQTTGKRIRFKVENVSASETPQIIAFYPELELRNERVA